MDLKELLGTKEGKSKDLYWAIVLEPGWIQAGIWEIIENKAEVVSVSPVTPWETDSEIIGASDAALSSAIQLLPEGLKEPSKTVFGVPPSWVDKGQIKEEYLFKIKNICTELSLEPSGFVVLSEAIAHLIKVEEGSPVNAIVTRFGKDFLELSVFKLGNLVGTTQVSRSVSFFDDVKEGLSRFSLADDLPSRIVIYDGKEGDLEEIKEALTDSNWENIDKVNFLHTPKIEILLPEKKVTAVALAGAAEIAGVMEIVQKKEELIKGDEFPQDHQNIVTPEESLSPEELGFVVGEDIASKRPPEDEKKPVVEQKPVYKENRIDLLRKKVGHLFSKILKRFTVGTPKFNGKKNLVVLGFVAGIFMVLFLLFWIFYPKAKVRVYVSPKKFEEKVEITVLKDSGSTDITNNIIAGKISSIEVSGEKTKSTTGIKKIGDKARGSVNVRSGYTDQNGNYIAIKLSVGTALLSSNNLKFILTNATSVLPAVSPANPGTQITEVTAYDIGAEYNLAKDEVFRVADYPKSVDAVATADFTGGSSRDISAVSSDDANNLLNSLTSELSGNAKKDLLNSIPSDQFLIEDSLTATASSKVFSNKIGDEASNLKLSLSLKSSAVSVSEKDLISLSQKVLDGVVPSGFYFDPSNLNFGFDREKDLSNATLFNLTIKAGFLPKEDLVSLARKISGKNTSVAGDILSQIPGFVRAEIDNKLKLLSVFGYLPKLSKNISIEILGER